jgi:hypothetical protein
MGLSDSASQPMADQKRAANVVGGLMGETSIKRPDAVPSEILVSGLDNRIVCDFCVQL